MTLEKEPAVTERPAPSGESGSETVEADVETRDALFGWPIPGLAS